MKRATTGWLSVALAWAVVLLAASNAWAVTGTMTLPGTGFDASGNALGNYGVDANWTVSGSPFGGSAAYIIMPGDPDWYFTWGADTASNGWSGSSWINDNDLYDGGGIRPLVAAARVSIKEAFVYHDFRGMSRI